MEQGQAKLQVVVGSVLTATPWWASAIETTSLIAGMIAAVCGAIVGLHGVYKIVKGWSR